MHNSKITFKYSINDINQLYEIEQSIFKSPIVFCGRSNVGKSSLLNALFKNGIAKTSNTPGRTQGLIIFDLEIGETTYSVIDIPGYGHAKVSKKTKNNWDNLLEEFFYKLGPKSKIVSIQDARHPLQNADKEFLLFIKKFPLEQVIVFNKIDKLKTQKERYIFQNLTRTMSLDYIKTKDFFEVSAEKKINTESLKNFLLN